MGHPTKTEAVAAAAQALPEVLAQVTKRPGGWKTSGLGSRHGAGGIRKYAKAQAILISRLHPKKDIHMFPYTEKTTNRLLKLFRFLWGRGSRD